MKQKKRINIGIVCIRTGMTCLLLMLLYPLLVLAEDSGYTLSLQPSTETVSPGQTIQMSVQVHNDGWPDSGEAEVAAFQATLEYDHESLEYVSIEVPEGTMGDYYAERGIVLGYGEGHTFQETLDCAVLTMKVAEKAVGAIPISIKDVVLARRDATELKASPAETLVLKIGSDAAGGTVSGQAENRAQTGSVDGGGSTVSGQGVQAGQEGTDPGIEESAGSGASGHQSMQEQTGGDSGKNEKNQELSAGSPDEVTKNDTGNESLTGDVGTTGALSSSSSASKSPFGTKTLLIPAVLLAALAAAAAVVYFIVQKGRRSEKSRTEKAGQKDGE